VSLSAGFALVGRAPASLPIQPLQVVSVLLPALAEAGFTAHDARIPVSWTAR
jgi:hypothetical protein